MPADIYEKIYNAMPANLQPLTQFLYFTGMRSGAAKQITWTMVVWEKVGDKQVGTGLQIPAGLMKNREAYNIPLVVSAGSDSRDIEPGRLPRS